MSVTKHMFQNWAGKPPEKVVGQDRMEHGIKTDIDFTSTVFDDAMPERFMIRS